MDTRLLEAGEHARLLATYFEIIRGRCLGAARAATGGGGVARLRPAPARAHGRAAPPHAVPRRRAHGDRLDGEGHLRAGPRAGDPARRGRGRGTDVFAAIESGLEAHQLLDGLPEREREREVVLLCWLGGTEIGDAARRLGMERSAVDRRCTVPRRRLRGDDGSRDGRRRHPARSADRVVARRKRGARRSGSWSEPEPHAVFDEYMASGSVARGPTRSSSVCSAIRSSSPLAHPARPEITTPVWTGRRFATIGGTAGRLSRSSSQVTCSGARRRCPGTAASSSSAFTPGATSLGTLLSMPTSAPCTPLVQMRHPRCDPVFENALGFREARLGGRHYCLVVCSDIQLFVLGGWHVTEYFVQRPAEPPD